MYERTSTVAAEKAAKATTTAAATAAAEAEPEAARPSGRALVQNTGCIRFNWLQTNSHWSTDIMAQNPDKLYHRKLVDPNELDEGTLVLYRQAHPQTSVVATVVDVGMDSCTIQLGAAGTTISNVPYESLAHEYNPAHCLGKNWMCMSAAHSAELRLPSYEFVEALAPEGGPICVGSPASPISLRPAGDHGVSLRAEIESFGRLESSQDMNTQTMMVSWAGHERAQRRTHRITSRTHHSRRLTFATPAPTTFRATSSSTCAARTSS